MYANETKISATVTSLDIITCTAFTNLMMMTTMMRDENEIPLIPFALYHTIFSDSNNSAGSIICTSLLTIASSETHL
jgi:hypothetical protein